MAELTFYADSGSDEAGQAEKADATYATARDASTSDSVTVGPFKVGQKLADSTYTIYRSAVCFDTSSLDDDCLIQSAVLTLKRVTANYGLGTIMLKTGAPTYPHIPIVTGDYDRTLYSGNGGTGSIVGSSCIITLNFAGEGWINKTGYTKFMVMSQNDINNTPPTANEWAQFYSSSTYRPVLVVTYTIPTSTATVGNASFTGTKDTFTVATATVSDAGDGYEERGFEYGTSEEPTWAIRETGIWSTAGDFSLTISGLQPSTTYYGRAFTTNAFGTTYSDDWVSFTTTASPSYAMYEEENTATINFYVRKVGGKWSIKHGPYTTDQSDIEITKIITEGAGKYQVKFESDVLTGISAGVMCKVDIKAR